MAEQQQYRLKIDVFSVDSLPMARLAEYMAELAVLLGECERVHFSHMEKGSAVLVSTIEPVAFPKVEERVSRVSRGDGPKDAMQAFKKIDNLLAKDGAVATLTGPTVGQVIEFPGRTRPKPVKYGPFREVGTLDGRIIRIGGRDETIPVWLKDGDVEYHCNVRGEEVARRLAPYYLNGVIRVHGSGKWVREESGAWNLEQFDINDFEVLDDSPMADVVGKLRAVEGGTWHESDDALSDILGLRRDDKGRH
ncbi:hypothetical protein FBZ93_12120 [Bradyrhizobium macuxiense]|uniref:Uncharacterized protein n=1 Tax=Bradyrhizobium macuxiense TaxID=1755647 RepID=A0A560KWI0_9BRAD|nr:hypothetical protein [Bradyrhizobium macuxiense]TWB87459.1 hypothetical protein FBZ93_12120 [Bradyrhizobium macuxiense]